MANHFGAEAGSALLFHAASTADWGTRTTTHYQPASLEAEGFIHFSSASQLLRPLNKFYKGRDDLILLAVEAELLDDAVVWEDLYDSGEKFPHLYGALNLSAVVGTEPLPCDEHGSFDWWGESNGSGETLTR